MKPYIFISIPLLSLFVSLLALPGPVSGQSHPVSDTGISSEKNDSIKTGTIEIKVKNIKNKRGSLKACLFSSPEGFPKDPGKASALYRTVIKDTADAAVIFRNVKFGRVAFVVFHDEDNNYKLNTGLFSKPKEGLCFSNNSKGFMGPPSFEKASFDFRDKKLNLTVRLIHY